MTVAVVERGPELTRIAGALDHATQGAGSLLLIEGEAGIGKTALLGQGRAEGAERGMLVLSARATELEREYPFGVVRQLLDPVLRNTRGRRREQLLDGVGDAAALWPALGTQRAGPASEFATLNGLWWLLANLAEERPLLAAVDDLQWCDQESLRFLGFLAPRVDELPVALVAATRPGQLDAAGTGWGRPLVPAPLSATGCAAVARQLLGAPVDDQFSAACHQTTGGNPFYLRAVLDELVRDGIEPTAAGIADRVLALRPSTVTNAIAARLATLPTNAVALARALAILGDGAPVEQLAMLAGVEPDAIADTTEQLAGAGILAPGAQPRFTHPIVAGAIEGDIGAAERDRLHRHSATLLRSVDAPVERTAAQLLACRPEGDPDAVEVLTTAARQSLERGAARSAVGYLRRALAEPPPRHERVWLLAELGLAELRLDGEGAVEHLREALVHAEPGQRPAVAPLMAFAQMAAGRWQDAAAAAAEALSVLTREDREQQRFLQATLLLCAQIAPGLEWGRQQVRSQLAGLEQEHGLGARLLETVVAFDDARRLAAPARVLAARVQHALEDGSLLSTEGLLGVVLGAAFPVLMTADPDAAAALVEQGLDSARKLGDVYSLAVLRLYGCLGHRYRGELAEAVADGSEGLELSRAWGVDFALEWGSLVAAAKLETGDFDDAEAQLASVAPGGAELGQHTNWLTLVDARARLHLARGQYRECLEDVSEFVEPAEALGWHNPAFCPWRSYTAECLAALGEQPERARELAAEEVELARRWGAPHALGVALRAQGLAHGGAGEPYLRDAVETLEGSPARLEHARALVELGAWLRRNGRRTEAREPLRAGLKLARTCGATPLAERAYQDLRATGASPRKLTRLGVAALTVSERRVARMAATGKTNKQIAQELYVTVKTVESHLAGAYRKLDIATRAELAHKLQSLDRDRHPDRDLAAAAPDLLGKRVAPAPQAPEVVEP